MHYLFVINPISGGTKNKDDLVKKIEETCSGMNLDYEVYLTKEHKDATRFVKEYCENNIDKETRIFACGGDGTFNEVVTGCIGYENIQVSPFPAGSGNDFIKMFTNNENFSFIEKQVNGTVRKIDVLKMGEIYAVNEFNIGFDASVAYKMNSMRDSILPTKFGYIAGIVSAMFKAFGHDYKVTIDDGEPFESNLLLCAMGNGGFYGGGFRALPLSSIDDGMMDVCAVDKISRLNFIKIVGKYKAGEHLSVDPPYEFIHYYKCKKITLEPGEVVKVCLDGEFVQTDKITVEIVPSAINLVVPEGCEPIEPKTVNLKQ
ncbi:MAG: YegS/Rv2252/BmrU family lipid kinase [Clostridiales bacterium]|nr:YegS/Rv2252/BmrU family lipid kinase [Clostridiales bacterium]